MAIDPQITAALIGGVAAIVAAVVGWWPREKRGRRKTPVSPKQSESDSIDIPNKNNYVSLDVVVNKEKMIESSTRSLSKITVKEIVELINSVPPFQKDQIANQYKGIAVKWAGYLKEAMEDPRDKESVRVNLTINQDTLIGYSFWFSEKVANFPEIRTLKRGSAISVLGEIQGASGPGLCVDLKPIAIERLENHV
jgi:hypothetical protein